MGFLAPVFLLGALAAAIPLLLHLRRRDRQKVIVFPSLMFLRGAPPPALRRRRLDNLLLLALRVAVVLLIAAAFARPVVRQLLPGALQEGGRDLVIVLDRSPSMRVGERMDAARRAALDEIGALGSRDRAAVVAFADRAAALTTLTGDRGRLEAAVREVSPSGGASRYAPALQLAARLLADGERQEGEIVLIGDLQRVGWSPAELGLLPAGTRLRVARAEGATDAAPERPLSVHQRSDVRGDRELATVSVRSTGDAAWRLVVDGRESGEARAEGPGLTTVDFGALPLPERALRAHVPLPAGGPDDAIRLVLERGAGHAVAVVASRDASRSQPAVAVALAASQSPVIEPSVWRGVVPPDRVLRETAAVVLDDPRISVADADRLLRWVESGGGLVVGLGPDAEQLPASLASAAGLTRGALVERPTATLATLDRSHPAFAGARGAGVASLPGTNVWRYYRLAPAPDASVLVRLDDGLPLLVEQSVGRGRVLTWASTFDDRWGTVVRHPGFVPLVHGLAFSASGSDLMGQALHTGSSVDLAALVNGRNTFGEPVVDGEVLTLAGPNQEREEVPVREGSAVAVLELPGFYEVRRGRGSESGLLLAVNVPPEEWSDERVAGEELMAAVSMAAAPPMANGGEGAVPATTADVEREQRLWWWVLLAVGALLALEGGLANRLARPYVSAGQGTGGTR